MGNRQTLCPLRSGRCEGIDCEWFLPEYERCSVPVMAERSGKQTIKVELDGKAIGGQVSEIATRNRPRYVPGLSI